MPRTPGCNLTRDDAADPGARVAAGPDRARRTGWLEDNAEAFRAQSEWHEINGHPLAESMVSPVARSWRP